MYSNDLDTSPSTDSSGLVVKAAAFHLRQELGDLVEITLFERSNSLGGRVADALIDGQRVELGGAVYSVVNRLVRDWVALFALDTFDPTDTLPADAPAGAADDRLGLWDGSRFVFQTGFSRLGNMVRGLGRYGFDSFRAKHLLFNDILPRFERIYDRLQRDKQPLPSVDAMLRLMEFEPLVHVTLRDFLLTNATFNRAFVDEMVEAMSRVNYGQSNSELHALVGLVSMVGGFGDCRTVRSGNSHLVRLLVNASRAETLLDAAVTAVSLDDAAAATSSSSSYRVEYLTTNEAGSRERRTRSFDAVVIASPLDSSGSQIALSAIPNIATKLTKLRPYHVTHATFVTGTARLADYFGQPSAYSSQPHKILATADASAFTSLVVKHRFSHGSERRLYKVFSRAALNDTLLDLLFDGRTSTSRKVWEAYPKLAPLSHAPDIVLHERLFYLNAFEYAFSTIETEALAGLNAALLVRDAFLRSAPSRH